jgi:hypothetical protein
MGIRFTDIPPATSEKIAKLIVRIGDDNDHEILAACRLIKTTLRSAGCDLHDLARQISVGREFTFNDIMRSMNERIRREQERHRDRKKEERKAKSAAAEAAARRKSVAIWSRRVAALRIQDWFDADQAQFVAEVAAKLAAGETLTKEERNKVQSLEGKAAVRKHKMRAGPSATWLA